jgi:selenocysteine lyase/cysteine desulfurase
MNMLPRPFDLERARAETPGCDQLVHLNNAGSALMPQRVLDAVVQHLQDEALLGGYEAADAAAAAIERVYDAAAALLGASADEIAIVENATRAWDMAFYSMSFAPGDRILTAQAEYASNYLAFLQVARRTGAVVEAIPNDEYGQVDLTALRNMIDSRVKLIAITHIPTNGGLVNPAAEIGQIARAAGVCYLLDACQSVGQMPIDVTTIGCDMLSATGRKYLRGPRGTGLLYVRRAWIERLEPPLIDLHAATWTAPEHYRLRSDARRFENWETNVAGKIGLGVAIDYACGWGLEAIWERVHELAARLRSRLREMPGVTVHDLGQVQCGIVSFTVAGHLAGVVRDRLRAQQINVSISRLTSTRLDMAERGLDELVRASVHYYNTEDEIDQLCVALRTL